MDSPAERYLGMRTIKYEDVAGKGAKQIPFNQVPVDKAAEYSAEDADITLRLHQVLWPQLEACRRSKRLYEEIEQPLVPVLRAWKQPACWSIATLLKAQSRELAQRSCRSCSRRRTRKPASSSTSIRPSSCSRSCSRSCSCR